MCSYPAEATPTPAVAHGKTCSTQEHLPCVVCLDAPSSILISPASPACILRSVECRSIFAVVAKLSKMHLERWRPCSCSTGGRLRRGSRAPFICISLVINSTHASHLIGFKARGSATSAVPESLLHAHRVWPILSCALLVWHA